MNRSQPGEKRKGTVRASFERLEDRRLLSAVASALPTALVGPQQVVTAATVQHPAVTAVSPAATATNVFLNAAVTAGLSLPNGGLDPSTVNTGTVTLTRNSDHTLVSSIVNTTGGGDAIILQPSSDLTANTSYTFTITSGVKDITGVTMTAFSSTFTTGTSGGTFDQNLAFQKISLPTAQGAGFTGMEIGPDGDLYAATEDGRIFRWSMNADGTLSLPEVITSLQQANGGNRLITGFAFDPRSTASNPILWVSNSFYALSGATNGVDFTGKITVMSGPDLQTVQDAVIDLPRSVADHVTNVPVFGPDGALYFAQAAENAYGAPDTTWGNRPEHLLSSAILRLDITRVTPGNPIDAKTPDVGGSYNPFAAGAPLTIYATGVRNAFDLLWDSQGNLWAPTNGSSSGGNTPAFTAGDPNQVNGNRIDTGQPYSGPNVPALTNIQQTEDDYLYKIVQGGYYGHPNPTRGEFVLDDGNPASGGVADEMFSAYPVGTNPDPNYRGANFDFGPHHSPDGIIQYTGTAFGGMLNGKMLVAEYSAGDDIAILSTDANDNVVSIDRSVSGLTGLDNPVDLIENPANGNIYVAELGADRISLLRPSTVAPAIIASTSVVAFNSIAAGNSGAGPSRAQTVSITNVGADPLTFGGGAFSIVNAPGSANAGDFSISNSGSLPSSLASGASFTVDIVYTASAVGLQPARLQISSNDPATPTLDIDLNGIGTPGEFGTLEPSLVQVLRAYDIPTIVGAGPNDVNINTQAYPENPDPTSEEVPMQEMVKAGTGPVTITPIASFSSATQPVSRIGYYTPGDITAKTELFTIASTDAQTVNPTADGATSFDPGSAPFSLYGVFPGTSTPDHSLDIHYSEDIFNKLDPTHPRKFRFFPLKTAAGAIVPNAYVVAVEDYNDPTFNSFINFVGIIRNVAPLPAGPVLSLQNPDGLPDSSSRLIFNRIQNQDPTLGDIFHDTSSIVLNNNGESALTVSALTLSDTTDWQLVNPPSVPFTIPVGGSQTLTVKFIATTVPAVPNNETNDVATTEPGVSPTQAGGVYNGTLTISSNDATQPNKAVQLAGYWQHLSAHEEEPSLQTLVNLMAGYGTNIASGVQPDLTQGSTPTYYGEEVVSSFWQTADTTQPVSVTMLDAFHNQGNTSQTKWFAQGSSTNNLLFKQATDESQSLFPHILGTSNPTVASFSPSGAFGWDIDGEFSQDSLNTVDKSFGRSGHAVRFYPLRDSSGNLIPNDWIMAMDYGDTQFDNYDFQDLAYIVTNMRPASTPPPPLGFQATLQSAGVTLQWEPDNYSGSVGYNVLRSSAANGTFTKLNSSTLSGTSFIDTTAAAGSTWFYQVKAVDTSNGNQSVGASSHVSLMSSTVTGNPSPPNAPTNLQGFGATDAVDLTWNASFNTNSYEVDREAPGDASFSVLATGITTTSYADTSAVPATTYSYRVLAINDVGTSPPSTAISAARGSGIVTSGTDVNLNVGGVKEIRFTDSDGTVATITLKIGTAVIHFDGNGISTHTLKGIETVTGSGLVMSSIDASGTTAASSLTIKTTKTGNGIVNLGSFSTDGSMKLITASTTNLTGNLSVGGTLSKLLLGSAQTGAITIGVAGPALTFQANTVSNETITTAGVIASIKANAWDGSSISAPVVRKITFLHNASLTLTASTAGTISVKGSLHDSTLTLSGANTTALTKLAVGALSNTNVTSAGTVKSVTTGSMLNSRVFAGIANLPVSQLLPESSTDFATGSAISSIKVKHSTAATFVNSLVAASLISAADLGTVQLSNNGAAFGVAGRQFKSLKFATTGGRKLALKNVLDPISLTNQLAASGLNLADMVVRIV